MSRPSRPPTSAQKAQTRLQKLIRLVHEGPRTQEQVAALLQDAADPLKEYRGRPGYVDWTPFDTAVEHGNLPALEAMWAHIHRPRRFPADVFPEEQRILAVHRACSLGPLKSLQWLMDKHILPPEVLRGLPLLACAVKNEKEAVQTVKWLLAEGWDPHDPPALLEAAAVGCKDPEVWQALIAAGADLDEPDEVGRTPRKLLAQKQADDPQEFQALTAAVNACALGHALPLPNPSSARPRL